LSRRCPSPSVTLISCCPHDRPGYAKGRRPATRSVVRPAGPRAANSASRGGTLTGGGVTFATTALNNKHQSLERESVADHDLKKQLQADKDARSAEIEKHARERQEALRKTRRKACYKYLKDLDIFREHARALDEDAKGQEESVRSEMFKRFTDTWTTLAASTSRLQVLGPRELAEAVNVLQKAMGDYSVQAQRHFSGEPAPELGKAFDRMLVARRAFVTEAQRLSEFTTAGQAD
jgi:hypothetical protein